MLKLSSHIFCRKILRIGPSLLRKPTETLALSDFVTKRKKVFNYV